MTSLPSPMDLEVVLWAWGGQSCKVGGAAGSGMQPSVHCLGSESQSLGTGTTPGPPMLFSWLWTQA